MRKATIDNHILLDELTRFHVCRGASETLMEAPVKTTATIGDEVMLDDPHIKKTVHPSKFNSYWAVVRFTAQEWLGLRGSAPASESHSSPGREESVSS